MGDTALLIRCPKDGAELDWHCGETGPACTWARCTACKSVFRIRDMHEMGTDYYGSK